MNTDFLYHLNRHIDISCVKSTHTKMEIDEMIQAAKDYQFVSVFAMPCYTSYVISCLKEEPLIQVGGVVGFPTGCDTTLAKVGAATELISMGCQELDMVMAYGMLKSKEYRYVYEDIKAVVKVNPSIPVKIIIEASYLNDYEIAKACEIAVNAGACFVKSGSGWSNIPTTPQMIQIMKQTVGEKALVKAAGGIRSLSSILELASLGCERFGISTSSAITIMEEVRKRL